MPWHPGDRVRCVSPAYGLLHGVIKAVGKTWVDVSWSHPDGTHRLVSRERVGRDDKGWELIKE
jgi:hypothetical protein